MEQGPAARVAGIQATMVDRIGDFPQPASGLGSRSPSWLDHEQVAYLQVETAQRGLEDP